MVDSANLCSLFDGIELAARLGKTSAVLQLSEIGRTLLAGSDVEVLEALGRARLLIEGLKDA